MVHWRCQQFRGFPVLTWLLKGRDSELMPGAIRFWFCIARYGSFLHLAGTGWASSGVRQL